MYPLLCRAYSGHSDAARILKVCPNVQLPRGMSFHSTYPCVSASSPRIVRARGVHPAGKTPM